MMAVAWRKHVTGSGGGVAIEGKMAGVVWYKGWIRGGRKKRVRL